MLRWLSGWDYPTRTQLAIGAAAAVGVSVGVAAYRSRCRGVNGSDDGGSPTPPGLRTISPPGPRNPSGDSSAVKLHKGGVEQGELAAAVTATQGAVGETEAGERGDGFKVLKKRPDSRPTVKPRNARAPAPGSPLVRSHRPRAAAATTGTGSAQIPPESQNGVDVDAHADSRGDRPIASPPAKEQQLQQPTQRATVDEARRASSPSSGSSKGSPPGSSSGKSIAKEGQQNMPTNLRTITNSPRMTQAPPQGGSWRKRSGAGSFRGGSGKEMGSGGSSVGGCLYDATFRNANTLYGACRKGQFHTATMFLTRGMDPDTPGKGVRDARSLHIAARQNRIEFVELLLAYNAEPNIFTTDDAAADPRAPGPGLTPLALAAMNGHTDVVRILFGAGAIVDHLPKTRHTTPLYTAYCDDDLEMLILLLTCSADPDLAVTDTEGNNTTMLSMAVEQDNVEFVRALVKGGADIDLAADDGITPTGRCVMLTGNVEIFDIMLAGGADVNKLDGHHGTPLYYAAHENSAEWLQIARRLIEVGADMTIADADGKTPVLVAVEVGNVDMLNLLINAGADVSGTVDGAGVTPLIVGSHMGHVDVVAALLNAGADPAPQAAPDNAFSIRAGETALSVSRGHTDRIASMLEGALGI